jgi:hypothetical protein
MIRPGVTAPGFVIEFTVPAQFQHALPHVHLSHGVHLVQLATARVPKGRHNAQFVRGGLSGAGESL